MLYRALTAAALAMPLMASNCATLTGVAVSTVSEGAKAVAIAEGRPDIAEQIEIARATASVGCIMTLDSTNTAASRAIAEYCIGRALMNGGAIPEVTE